MFPSSQLLPFQGIHFLVAHKKVEKPACRQAGKTCRSEKFPAQQWLAALKTRTRPPAGGLKQRVFLTLRSPSCATEIFQGCNALPIAYPPRRYCSHGDSVYYFCNASLF